ncbi:copper homeostasis periplasmic binding protein CopC [uncultured Brevundimonas sp.]|uniref:copper homeostasis periplasmic binding protein CopC n=1 Tax=uncultured Brevundimonas sp. TaxID=213418 RepID=UPI0030EC6681|tara:strand:+ start:988 stop:1347 length:360 start_codon:yes stop_codon:yes gene_type:complete
MYFDRVLPVALVMAVSLTATAASAHAHLTAATPAAESTVTAPRSVTLTFSERLIPAFSSLEIVSPAGTRSTMASSVSEDGKSLVGALSAPLTTGRYTVHWAIASGDGHRMTGNHAFTVR